MFKKLRLIIIASSLLLCACSEKTIGDKYFPLQEGLSWKYDVTTQYVTESSQSKLAINNIGKVNLGDKSYYIRRTSSGIDYYINFDDKGIYREAIRTLVEMKPRLDEEKRYIFKYPLSIDSHWITSSQPLVLLNVFPFRQRATGLHFPMSYKIESLNNSITVPAGVFENCLKIIGEGVAEVYTDAVNGFNEIKIVSEEWYAPDVGLVKMVRYEMDGEIIKISDTPAYLGGHTKLELTHFDN